MSAPNQVIQITIKRKSKKKSGFEVELRDDGHYYISAVPKENKSINVGDRVLEINGTKVSAFKNAEAANDFFDSFTLGVIPGDDEDDDSEDE